MFDQHNPDTMRLRDVTMDDVDTYVRMRCDPVMMAELGGPVPKDGIEAKVRRDAQSAADDREWIKVIVVDGVTAGNVCLWAHEEDGATISEMGWMVLPEFQGRGLGKAAVRELLRLAALDGRWGVIHALPATTNAPSNGICRSVGFTHAGERDVTFGDTIFRGNHWHIDPQNVA